MDFISLGITAGAGLLSSIFGGSQRSRANRMERQNIRPVYTANRNIRQNLADAEYTATQGLPSRIYNNQLRQMQQGLTTGLRTLGRGGTSPYNVSSILSGYNRSISNLGAMDAQAQLQNRQQLYRARGAMADEESRAFNINQLQPYQQTRQEIASLRRAGDQNIFGGIGLIAQGAMTQFGTNTLENNRY